MKQKGRLWEKTIEDAGLTDSEGFEIIYYHCGQEKLDITADTVIQAGDVVLLEVKDSFFYRTRNEVEFSAVKKLSGARIQRTDKALAPSLIILTMVL